MSDDQNQSRRGSSSSPDGDQAGKKKKKAWTRQRTGTPRSRSGCITCKIRHTKCDEARPFCLRCTKSGFQCDGYGAPPAQEKKKLPAPLELAITSYALPFRVPGSQEDRRMLHYFCVQAAEDLAGFLSPEFWNKIVLQRSHDEQVVRQAVIALSSVHLENAMASEEETSNNAVLGASEEIMVQYNKSLRCLRKYLNHANTKGQEQPSLVVILICCALFYSFESARGNYDAALQHLRMGIAILNDKPNRDKMSQTAQDLEDMFKLEDLFQRLDLQASMYDYDRTPLLDLTSPEEKAGSVSCVGANPIRSLDEAHSMLAKLQNWLFHLLIPNPAYKFYPAEGLPPTIVQQKRELTMQFELWHEKFQAFLDTGDDGRPQEHGSPGSTTSSSTDSSSDLRTHPSALLALIHYNNATLFLASSLPFDGEVFDAPLHRNPHRDKIEAILQHSESVIMATQQSSSMQSPKFKSSSPSSSSPPPKLKSSKRRIISAETGVVAPLMFLAVKSGDLSVVRRAQQLLESSERKEGLYDARVSAVVAKKLMDLSDGAEQAKIEAGESTVPRSIEWRHIDILDGVVGVDELAKTIGVTPVENQKTGGAMVGT